LYFQHLLGLLCLWVQPSVTVLLSIHTPASKSPFLSPFWSPLLSSPLRPSILLPSSLSLSLLSSTPPSLSLLSSTPFSSPPPSLYLSPLKHSLLLPSSLSLCLPDRQSTRLHSR